MDWAEVYRNTYPDLVRFLYHKVWDADRARDLAQEVFVRALRHQPDQPRSWLYTVAANLARDEARGAIRRRKHLALLKSERQVEGPARDEPVERMERERRADLVRQALDRLTDRDREALLLWQAGLSYTEIAEQTGLARGAVGTTLSRARKRLVEAYHQMEKELNDVARG